MHANRADHYNHQSCTYSRFLRPSAQLTAIFASFFSASHIRHGQLYKLGLGAFNSNLFIISVMSVHLRYPDLNVMRKYKLFFSEISPRTFTTWEYLFK